MILIVGGGNDTNFAGTGICFALANCVSNLVMVELVVTLS